MSGRYEGIYRVNAEDLGNEPDSMAVQGRRVGQGRRGRSGVDRGLSAARPAIYGLVHPLAAIAAAHLPLVAAYLIMRA